MTIKRIFIDTETTSSNRDKAGVYQIAGVIEYDKIYKEFNFFCNIFDGDLVEESAFETNHCSLDKILSFPEPKIIFQQFIELLNQHIDCYNKSDKFIAIGYFSEFDNQILRNWFKKNNNDYFGSYFWYPWIDVSQLAAYAYQEDRNIFPNFKLETVAYAMSLIDDKDNSTLHNALTDVKITRKMYLELNKILSN